jgi:hypothetical protein
VNQKGPDKTDVQFPPPHTGLAREKPAPVFLPDFEPADGSFSPVSTQVTNIAELQDWLDHSAELDMVATQGAYDPEVTGVLSMPKLDHLKTVAKSGEHVKVDLNAEGDHDESTVENPNENSVVSGSLGEFSLMDLIQLFASGGRTGLLACTDGVNTSRVYLDAGAIAGATWNEADNIDSLESLKNAAAMEKGQFFFGPSERKAPQDAKPMTMLQVALAVAPPPDDEDDDLGGFPGFDFDDSAQLDAMAAPPFPGENNSSGDVDPPTLPQVPAVGTEAGQASLYFPQVPMEAQLRELSGEELDVFQLALNHQTLDAILQNAQVHEVEVKDILQDLVLRGYLNCE